MPQKIQVLIENFNRKIGKYEIGRQEIINLSVDELEELFKIIPIIKEDQIFPTQIITKDFIFKKKDKNLCKFEYNFQKSSKKGDTFKIDNFASSFRNWTRETRNDLSKIKTKNITSKINSSLMYFLYMVFLFLIPILYEINIFIAIIWIWLLLVSLVGIYYQFSKKTRKRLIEYTFPILDDLEIVNISEGIIFLSQYFNLGFFLIITITSRAQGSEIQINFYFWVTIAIIFLIPLLRLLFVYLDIRENKNKKDKIIQFLYNFIQNKESLKWEAKHYYLQLILELEKRPLIKAGVFPKLIAILSFLLLFIPFI